MAKVSFAASDTYVPALGFQEGNFEVTGAKISVFQYPPSKKTGEQLAPFLACVLTLQKTDEQGNATEDEPMEKPLRAEKDLGKMRPGNAQSREDDEPEDLGDELNTEGNCIYAEENAKINANTQFAKFMKSLEEKGFRADILGAGYMPDLIGLKGHAKSEKGEKQVIDGRDVEANYFVVDRITVRPYEKSTAKKPTAKASTAASAATSAAKPATKPAAKEEAEAPEVNEDAAATATAILAELATELEGETRDAKKLFSMCYSRLVREKDRNKKLDKEVQELFKNEAWLIEAGADLGFTFEDGVFTFGTPVAA